MIEFLSGVLAGLLIYHFAGYIATKINERKENSLLFKNPGDKPACPVGRDKGL